MDNEVLKVFGIVAGIGGLSLGVFLILFRNIIRKNIFPNLKQAQAYSLLRLISILVWSIALIGIAAWAFTSYFTKLDSGSINIPSFKTEISSDQDGENFEQFIGYNRGKIVYVSTKINPAFVRLCKTNGDDDLFIALEPCEGPRSTLDCAGFHLLLNGDNHVSAYHNQGVFVFNGYFVIEEDRWMHQGIYYNLKSIPRESVLLRQSQ